MMPFPSARLPFGFGLWIAARLMPQVIRGKTLGEILRRATPAPHERAYCDLSAEEIVVAVKAAAARPWRMRQRRCLREGVLAFHYLSLAGHRPLLHFGLVPETIRSSRPMAHCWITVGGEAVLNPPTTPMLDLFAYDGLKAVPPSAGALSEALRDG